MISPIAALVVLGAAFAEPNVVSGTVTDSAGKPIAAARVFLEPGIGGEVIETPLTPEGRFVFADVPAGDVGVFAAAPGRGYAGQHIRVTLSEDVAPVGIKLPEADLVVGTVTDSGGRPVQNARITRVALLGQKMVAIPLTKLQVYGFPEPETDAQGRFVIPSLPKGASVALKVGHPEYAVEGVNDVHVGTQDLRITLYRGEFIQGDVLSRSGRLPVANADILITNAQPPYDTTLARTDQSGIFSVRLKPGVYSYRASSAGLRSSGGDRLVVTGSPPQPRARLFVAGSGTIHGTVYDTRSGQGVASARIHLYTGGSLSAIARTGSDGEYRFDAIEGENVIRLESAPGYLPPNDQTVVAQVAEGGACGVPDLWIAPLPKYEVLVVDGNGEPVPGALVSLVQPSQFGVHSADSNGRAVVHIGNAPAEGGIIGMVQDPGGQGAAIFRIAPQPEAPATVQVFPLSGVSGRVVNDRGRGVEGAIVGGILSTGVDEPVVLWRTVSDAKGLFRWAGVVPGVPQQCAAETDRSGEGTSVPFNLAPGEAKEIGNLVIHGARSAKSLLDETLEWRRRPVLAGGPASPSASGKSLIMYCTADQADMVIEGLAAFRDLIGAAAPACAVVVDGAYAREQVPFPVLSGEAPGRATTYVLDAEDRVVFETLGLPPLFALR